MGLFGKDTTNAAFDDQGDAGTGVPTEDVDVVPAPSDPKERQAFIQSLVADVTDQHSGEPLDAVITALSERIAASGLPEQPVKWVTDTASEIAEGRHVVVDRHLAVGTGDGADELPDEARTPQA